MSTELLKLQVTFVRRMLLSRDDEDADCHEACI
jgi:hypothetical protein